MPNPVTSAGGPTVLPLRGHEDSFTITPTSAEKIQIAAARAHRAEVGYGFQQAANSRHRLAGFDYGKATLKASHMRYLREHVLTEARQFKGRPRFVIRGHASRSGPADGNLALSRRRAKAVASYLQRLVPNAKVVIQAAGESEPHQAGAKDGSEDFMDRSVEIGVMRAGVNRAQWADDATRVIEAKKLMKSTFKRFAVEAGIVGLLKGLEFPTAQSLLQSLSGRNRPMIRNGYLQHILNRSWPVIHKRYPSMPAQRVVETLREWHQENKEARP